MLYEDINKNENLSIYGKTFQYRLVYVLLTDKQHLEQIYDILDEKLFSTSALKWVVEKIKEYYIQYSALVDLHSFKVFIRKDNLDDLDKVNIKETLKDIYKQKNIDIDKISFVKNESVNFFRSKKIEEVFFNDALEFLKEKEYDKMKGVIDDALLSGVKRNLGIEYKNNIEERYSTNSRNPISTGWPIIDEYMDGGPSDGELGIFLGASSIGKSWALEHLALNVVKNGFNVVYYTLEDAEGFHTMRKDSILTGIQTTDLKFNIDVIKEEIDKLKGNLIVKFFPSGITTVSNIQAHLKRLQIMRWKPDLVVIDYGDIMAPIKSFRADWLNQKQIYEELKTLTQVENLRLWTAAQASKEGGQEEIVTATSMAQAYAKVAPCNFIFSISRSIEDKLRNTGRLHLAKNKVGQDAITFPCEINHSKGIFKPLAPYSKEGQELNDLMKNGKNKESTKKLKESFRNFEMLKENIEK